MITLTLTSHNHHSLLPFIKLILYPVNKLFLHPIWSLRTNGMAIQALLSFSPRRDTRDFSRFSIDSFAFPEHFACDVHNVFSSNCTNKTQVECLPCRAPAVVGVAMSFWLLATSPSDPNSDLSVGRHLHCSEAQSKLCLGTSDLWKYWNFLQAILQL